jgi:hypothetical protein
VKLMVVVLIRKVIEFGMEEGSLAVQDIWLTLSGRMSSK